MKGKIIIIWIGLEIYKANVLGMGVTGIENILLYLLSCMMSFLIYVLFDFCFGMIGFFTTYIFGLEMIKESVLLFLTGQLIPLSFFPQAVQNIFSYLPFSSMVYTPVMIYLGKYTGAELIKVLIISGQSKSIGLSVTGSVVGSSVGFSVGITFTSI